MERQARFVRSSLTASTGSGFVLRVSHLLFATTLLSFFAYILFFVAVGLAGNGGEYWGFNGLIEPHKAASAAIDRGDYRFLRANLFQRASDSRVLATDNVVCESHPRGVNDIYFSSSAQWIHGIDSPRLARDFAASYNNRISGHLYWEFGVRCEILRRFRH